MRDPKRIPEVLAAIEKVWRKHPDLRLGQLIVIGARPKQPCPEIFHLEDEALITGVEAYGNKPEAGDA